MGGGRFSERSGVLRSGDFENDIEGRKWTV